MIMGWECLVMIYGGFHSHRRYPNSRMVVLMGKILWTWMIRGYPHLWKPQHYWYDNWDIMGICISKMIFQKMIDNSNEAQRHILKKNENAENTNDYFLSATGSAGVRNVESPRHRLHQKTKQTTHTHILETRTHKHKNTDKKIKMLVYCNESLTL